MIRKTLIALSLSVAAMGFGASSASAQSTPAQSTPTTTNPLKCVGAAEHKQAQALRLQAAESDLAGLQARRAAAVQAGKNEAVARIDARIARVNARIATIKANQAKFAARCP